MLHDYLRLGIDEANEKFVKRVICDLPDSDTSFLPLAKEALVELHVQKQRKKDKWFGEDDSDGWLNEFEKLALLELTK